jgi:hypothetical protein
MKLAVALVPTLSLTTLDWAACPIAISLTHANLPSAGCCPRAVSSAVRLPRQKKERAWNTRSPSQAIELSTSIDK